MRGQVRDDLLAGVADDHDEVLGVEVAGGGERRGRRASGRTISCRTLGVADFIRVPSPAARTTTAAGLTEWLLGVKDGKFSSGRNSPDM